MKLLLDSHALLWWTALELDRVSPRFRAAVAAAEGLAISVATIWELEIKRAAGKLALEDGYWLGIEQAGVEVLPLLRDDAIAAAALPLVHRDPFDRMIVAQAMRRGLTLVSADHAIAAYPVTIIRP